MATKAQQFRAEVERSHPNKKKAKRAMPVREERLTHNEAHRLDKKKSYALEATGARASRKSTRGGDNRAKPDSAMRITVRVRNSSPEARAARKSGNPN
jgi:hypothetical protein